MILTNKKGKKMSRYFLVAGTISFLLVLLFFIFLNFFCQVSQGLCVLFTFLMQTPAYYVSLLFGKNLSTQSTTLLFRVTTAISWFVFGGVIGWIIYYFRRAR